MKTLDLVRIKKDGKLAIIDTVTNGQGVFQFSLYPLEGTDKMAWYDPSELEFIANIAETLSFMVTDRRCSSVVEFKMSPK